MEVFALQRSLIWLVKLHVAAPRERASEQGGVASVWQIAESNRAYYFDCWKQLHRSPRQAANNHLLYCSF